VQQLPLAVGLRDSAVFDNFFVGPNAEVLAALRSGEAAPLWIWGAAATGKTHLLQAACAAAPTRAAYFPLAQSAGAQAGVPAAALLGYESTPLLCVDDVDAVAGDEAAERILFALFNAANECGSRLIFAAGAAPRAVAWCLADWASRAGSCAIYQLNELDDFERVRALQLRAAARGLEMPEETANYVLRRLPRDLPRLFDLLDTLDQASLAAQRRLTVPFVRAALDLNA
jgi:DnaA-homolog protein